MIFYTPRALLLYIPSSGGNQALPMDDRLLCSDTPNEQPSYLYRRLKRVRVTIVSDFLSDRYIAFYANRKTLHFVS